ncbi:molybdenum cofactor guanylyltransferase MobA [Neorhizobium galegae]|uniref:molybdenum cofactor guanylyltransferase MobA n=1 Tax=Neorhizobium galegae TaxID=399 RepID=UPI0006229025|nr:molybdenum cofactor guanylyltransferase MobA [Neorhizobium galegae]CDZ30461.1 Molybdenum cofactor guanylyltransferase [Neorhizobium galegae bv. officinalis]KAA9387112.1 molybdenum cofactor guanylyltransferase MobA [Neorhizobium galegae]MCM2497360.1 molybdenum cofactor guanylyltransferase MobA [Neorhizobium galegae]MCQ1771450.1 molybdenum cofactor guanylyltransferase MobA [Neorhizobium galegae]MCQ1778468.1 molybdenum cofactor guanylyltransferase MobA [Neorhizobium galegae]
MTTSAKPPTRPPGLILAGGKSSRMGADKAFLTIGGDTILGHVVRRLLPQTSEITLNAPTGFPNPLGLRLLPDPVPGQIGPLAGVLAGLRDIKARGLRATHLLTVPSDSPFGPADLVRRLETEADDPDAIVIASSDGRDHPVFGLWPVSLAGDLETWLSDPDNRRIKAFLERHRVATVEFPVVETPQGLLDPFFNINTPEDLQEARRFAEELS